MESKNESKDKNLIKELWQVLDGTNDHLSIATGEMVHDPSILEDTKYRDVMDLLRQVDNMTDRLLRLRKLLTLT